MTDVATAYWQISVHPDYVEQTAFVAKPFQSDAFRCLQRAVAFYRDDSEDIRPCSRAFGLHRGSFCRVENSRFDPKTVYNVI